MDRLGANFAVVRGLTGQTSCGRNEVSPSPTTRAVFLEGDGSTSYTESVGSWGMYAYGAPGPNGAGFAD